MSLYGAIDLHSDNSFLVIIDEQDHPLVKKRFPNQLPVILDALAPYKNDLAGIAVESTFNWYWLVDGLLNADYIVKLVNTAAVKQYEGLKYTDDASDAFWLAHLMRLNILPTGYIYPQDIRSIRDLLRKRLQLVRQRVTHLLSAQNQLWRSTGIRVPSAQLKKVDFDVLSMLNDPLVQHAVTSNLNMIAALNSEIDRIEKTIKKAFSFSPEYQALLSIDGIGDILGFTIALETGDIHRFPSAAHFASYARCVDSKRISNGKQKSVNNRHNGNRYLAWAFVEAAHSIIRHNKTAHQFYQHKRAQKNAALATKALANKLARAAYYVMRDHVPFRCDLLFR